MQFAALDRTLRTCVPSIARISFNPVVKAVGDSFAYVLSLPFAELRDLPPNHLRIRVGVDNRILANHVQYLRMGDYFWRYFCTHNYCKFNSDVVELGCGCGRIANPLRDDWFEGTYVGIDIDQEMIEYCRHKFTDERFQFILSPHYSKTYSSIRHRQERQPAFTIAGPDSKDFVYSISLYSHLLETEFSEYLVESFRILRPSGLMFMTFFCIDHVERGSRWTLAHRNGNAFIENEEYPEAAVAYEQAYVVDLVKQIGFREVCITPRSDQSQLVAQK